MNTYELDLAKNMITAENGVTEEQLNSWKEKNFGSGTFNNSEGSISISNSNFDLNNAIIRINPTVQQKQYVIKEKRGMVMLDINQYFTIFNETDIPVFLLIITKEKGIESLSINSNSYVAYNDRASFYPVLMFWM